MLESLHFFGVVDYEEGKMAHVETCDDREMPLNIFIDNYEDYAGLEECYCEIDIQGVSRDVEIFDSEEDYCATAHTMAPVSLIPVGTFPLNPQDDDFKPSPYVSFSGIVQDAEIDLDTDENTPNCKLTIETYGFTFDLYIHYDGNIELQGIVCGTAWLYGDIHSIVYDKDMVLGKQREKAAITPDDVVKLLKPPKISLLSKIRNSDKNGNNAFVIWSGEEKKVHVSTVTLSMEFLDPIIELLSITRGENAEIGIGHVSNLYDGRNFLILYNPVREKPYPLVVAAKYTPNGDDTVTLVNAAMEDMGVVSHIQEDFLTAKKPFNLPLELNENWNGKDATLLTQVGYAYERGTIFKQNYEAALYLYKIAAKAGDAIAVSNIGWLYHQGFRIEKNITIAMGLYQIAAEAGCTTAMVNLGNIYENGELGEPDYKTCFKWYKMAAEAGDRKGLFNYANCYHWGYGVRKNYKKAFPIFRELADQGYPGASFYVGLYYQTGKGVKRDYAQARQYYRMGVLEGDAFCFCQLGVMYAKGKGVQKDMHAALDYYTQAAKLGDPLAYTNIGWFYENGDLGDVSLDKAIDYYQKAAEQGEPNAQEVLKRLGIEEPHRFSSGETAKDEIL